MMAGSTGATLPPSIEDAGIPPYDLTGFATLGELHAQLPPGTRWSDRQPADPPEVVEVWFLPAG